MPSQLSALLSSLLVALGASAGQVFAANPEPLASAETIHFDQQSFSGYPAIAITPEGRRFDAYIAEHNGGIALLGRLDYLRDWHLYAPWPDLVQFEHHPELAAPAITMDATGNVLAAWTLNGEGSSQGVFARALDEFGQFRGEAFRVDSLASNWSGSSVVATNSYGLRFLVAWKSHFGTGPSVRARLYDNNLQSVGSELLIDVAGSDSFMPIAAAWSPVGWTGMGYVAWTGPGPGAQLVPATLWIRSVDAYGQLGPAIPVVEYQNSTSGLAMHDMPALGMDAGGNLVLTWRQLGRAEQGSVLTSHIMGMILDANLQPLVPTFQVSEAAEFSGAHQPPAISVAHSGDFVIAWGQSQEANGPPIMRARQFDANGTARGPSFAVTGDDDGGHYTSRVAMDADGDTTFAWTRLSADGGSVDAMLRRYRGDAEIDLAVGSSESVLTSHPGGALSMQLQGVNLANPPDGGFDLGERFATGLAVGVELPVGTQLLDAYGPGWACSNGDSLICVSSVALEGGGATRPLELQLLAPETTGNYSVRASIVSDQRDSSLENNSIELPLTVAVPQPDAFSFLGRNGVGLDTVQESEPATLSGFSVSLPIAVAYGEYSINETPFTTVPGFVVSGDVVRVRHMSASRFETTVTTLLYVGEFEAQFATTTETIDLVPDVFDFQDVVNAPRKRDIYSNLITVSGINADTSISISDGGATYSKNGGAYTNATGLLRNGDTVRLRMRSANPPNSTTGATVEIGGLIDIWRVTTGR